MIDELIERIERAAGKSNKVSQLIWKLNSRIDKARKDIQQLESELPYLLAQKHLEEIDPLMVGRTIQKIEKAKRGIWEFELTIKGLQKPFHVAENTIERSRRKLVRICQQISAEIEETGTCADPVGLRKAASCVGSNIQTRAEALLAELEKEDAA